MSPYSSELATFKVHNTFSIPNRGFCIAGDVIHGTIHKGDFVVISSVDKTLTKISAIEFLRSKNREYVTLVIEECAVEICSGMVIEIMNQ
ncbi:hypothetical protein [Candidatus Uabimicrobium amorphum]|uniref:Translation elongation factor EFTu-like domain-containing protein n=1 Tax=Uabimicrobium amorphum TaxID=2596890 RepID=A0A5S9F680_UABAM|nr:hypothetical protein [Candidatus Uabimicrobium amorphum]BBM87606.1 hypothetical protein UABAM_06018 [Candidatus Uabimicrobium amorphum]